MTSEFREDIDDMARISRERLVAYRYQNQLERRGIERRCWCSGLMMRSAAILGALYFSGLATLATARQ